MLRHTFLCKLAEQKGVHYGKEASAHKSDCYIWRYVKPSPAHHPVTSRSDPTHTGATFHQNC